MRRAERIIFAFAALGEAAQPPALAQRADPVAPAGKDLVGIGLVPDVPDQPVIGRVEHVMDRDRQLDDAEPGAQVPTRHRHGRDRFRTQLVRELAQPLGRQGAQIVGVADGIEQRSFRDIGHGSSLQRRSSGRNRCQPSAQSGQRPCTSITGRTGSKPDLVAMLRTVVAIESSSTWVAWPQLSHTRKMQSCRQSGCSFAT